MHKTTSGEKRKALRKEALELAMQSRAAMKAAGVLPQAGHKARELQEGADRLRAEAEALKDRARLEDLSSGPWRSQEQQEGQQDLLLLDGHLAGGELCPGWIRMQLCRRPGP